MKSLSIFNNKGGVGKSTLTFHLAHALGEINKKVLIVDADPQCNVTLYGLDVEEMHSIWEAETEYIDTIGFEEARAKDAEYQKKIEEVRTLHFLLKPTEEGTGDIEKLPPLKQLRDNVFLLPGRLSLHSYEEAIASRWSDAFVGNPLAIRTIGKLRLLVEEYAKIYNIEYVLFDTSPSIGILNKIIISTTDALLIPCNADMFSLYGIRNIGSALAIWKKQFEVLKSLLSDEKKKNIPQEFVKFIGYTIYNTRKISKDPPLNELDIAQSNFHYARMIPNTILSYIHKDIRIGLTDDQAKTIIGGNSIIHSHNTLPGMAQKYKQPMWVLPSMALEAEDNTVKGNRGIYEATREKYIEFAKDLMNRLDTI